MRFLLDVKMLRPEEPLFHSRISIKLHSLVAFTLIPLLLPTSKGLEPARQLPAVSPHPPVLSNSRTLHRTFPFTSGEPLNSDGFGAFTEHRTNSRATRTKAERSRVKGNNMAELSKQHAPRSSTFQETSDNLIQAAEKLFETELCQGIAGSLRTLATYARNSHPQFGMQSPLEPLYGAAPLKYVHEGDLLKLRLTLENITLHGFSSMTVQEVKIIFDPLQRQLEHPEKEYNKGQQASGQLREVTGTEFYDDYDPYLYHYDYYEQYSNVSGRNGDQSNVRDTERQFDVTDRLVAVSTENYESSDMERFHYDYVNDGLNVDSKFLRHKPSTHTKEVQPRIAQSDEKPKKTKDHGYDNSRNHKKSNYRRAKLSNNALCYLCDNNDEFSNKEDEMIAGAFRAKRSPFTRMLRQKRAANHKSTANTESSRSLEGVVRVAFTALRLTSSYLIRGSAGDVFTFRDRGRFEVTSSVVYLVSKLKVLVPPTLGRHNRANGFGHSVRVETEESISPPEATLHPYTTPPLWLGKQVKLKLEELASGIKRHRDGAVRHLLRHWERLLRRVVLRSIPTPMPALWG